MSKQTNHWNIRIGALGATVALLAGLTLVPQYSQGRGFGGFHGGFGGFHGGFGGFHGGFGGFHGGGGFGGFHGGSFGGGSRFGDGGLFDRGGDSGFGRGGFGSIRNSGTFSDHASSFASNHPQWRQGVNQFADNRAW